MRFFPNKVSSKETAPDHAAISGPVIASLVAGGAVMALLVVLAAIFLYHRNYKWKKKNSMQFPGIVVYPHSFQDTPQFLTKEIRFSLPPLRYSSSVADLSSVGLEPINSDPALYNASNSSGSTDTLSNAHALRSKSVGTLDPGLYRKLLGPREEDEDWSQYPDDHIGRIWFTLAYEPESEKLLVTLLRARNLPSRTFATANSCDPYVRIHLQPDERRYVQSKQLRKTCNPNFDETFVFQVPAKDLAVHLLKLSVMDSGRSKRRTVIGHVLHHLKELDSTGTERLLLSRDLEKEVSEEPLSDLGELLVSLVYNESVHRLSVTIIQAKRLKVSSDVKGRSSCFVRVCLNRHGACIKVKKTQAEHLSSEEDFHFSEQFHFKFSHNSSPTSNLSFHVFQVSGRYGRDKLLGRLVLGSHMFARGRALVHWTSAFSRPMQPVQQWHPLCP